MIGELSPKEIRDKLRNSIKLGISVREVEELSDMLQKHKSRTNSFSREIEAMSKKTGKDRYIYTIKRIAGLEKAWTLKNEDGLVSTEDEEKKCYYYIWPYKEYAQRCMIDDWKDFVPLELSLEELLEDILPCLVKKDAQIVALEVPNDLQITSASANDFLKNLLYECSQYK